MNIFPYETTRMELVYIMQSEICQSERQVWYHLYMEPKKAKQGHILFKGTNQLLFIEYTITCTLQSLETLLIMFHH